MNCIAYKGGYKYQLQTEYTDTIGITPERDLASPGEYVTLSTLGFITIKKGYAWDGPSGPTIDTKNFMRGSLVHDALYQLMREDELDRMRYRDPADRILTAMCRADGMSWLRSQWVYLGVKWFAADAAASKNRKKIVHAPDGCP